MTLSELKTALRYPNMTVRMLAVVFALADGKVKSRDIAISLGVPRPSICRAMDGLCDSGLMKRVRSEEDARDVFGVLTEKGKSMLKLLMTVVVLVLMAGPVMAGDDGWQPLGGTPMTQLPAPTPYPTQPLGGTDIR